MDTVRFRLWDKKENVLLDDITIAVGGSATWPSKAEILVKELGKQSWRPIDSDRYAAMQYTGLKDDECKKIYEGDIVRVTGSITSEIKEVFWYQRYNYTECGFYPFTCLDPRYVPYRVEVIGNIYQNPELLWVMSHEEGGGRIK
jgi:uncharacterized phage protein (TIGR01671 family)